MRHILTLALAGSLGLAMAGGALAQSRTFDLDGFQRLDINSGIDARVTLGDSFSITARSDNQEALDKLEVTVSGDTLTARFEQSFLDFIASGGLVGQLLGNDNALSLDITLPALTGVSASSGADVAVQAPTGDLDIDVSSGADVSIAAAALGTVRVNTSSGSDADLDGTCTAIDANASSGSDLDAGDLQCASAVAEASSGSDLSVFATQRARAEASSGGDVYVSGNPAETDFDHSSGGNVTLDD